MCPAVDKAAVISPVALSGTLAVALLAVCVLSPAHSQSSNPSSPTDPADNVSATNVTLRTTGFTTSDGVRLNVIEAGPESGDGPVIAFVPGWSMPASIWQVQLLEFGARHRVAALDPRGQGESDVPEHGYSIDRRAEDLREFIARYPKVLLVAWSLGALEALHYLHLHGDKAIAGLVIVDSSVGEEPAPPKPVSGKGFVAELRRDRTQAVEGFVQAIFLKPQPRERIEALRDAALRMPLEGSISLFPSKLPRTHWRNATHGFSKPLLYVVTKQFAGQGTNLRKNRRGTKVILFRDAGHALFVDDAPRFNRLLGEFVSGVPGFRR